MKRRILIGIVAVTAIACTFWYFVGGWYLNRGQLGRVLGIELPGSVHSIACHDAMLPTDTMVACTFRVDARDFPKLLEGEEGFWPSTEVPAELPTHPWPATGEKFKPAFLYAARPKDSPHGGSLAVYADATKTRVYASLYIE